MKVGIFNVKSGKSKDFISIFKKILEYNNIDYVLLDYDNNFWNKIIDIDYYIHRFVGTDQDIYIANSILPIIENVLNKSCYPNFKTYWSYEDKIKEYFLMLNNEFPMVKSFIFFDKNEAFLWIESINNFPIIFKLKSGAGSSNVIKVNDRRQAKKIVKRLFGRGVTDQGIPSYGNLKYLNPKSLIKHSGTKILTKFGFNNKWPVWQIHKNYALFQEFLPNNKYDTRVTTIGKRAFAFRRLNRKNDFRSSGSGLIDYDINCIDKKFVKIALDISNKMQFQSMAYDFIYDKDNEPVFCEISYTCNDKAIYNCPGFWDEELNFVEGNFWPQFYIIKDLLNIDNLRQPTLL